MRHGKKETSRATAQHASASPGKAGPNSNLSSRAAISRAAKPIHIASHERVREGVLEPLTFPAPIPAPVLRRFAQEVGMLLVVILIILILGFGYGGYRVGPGWGYYGGGGVSLILTIILILLLLRVI